MDQKQKNEELYKAALPAFFNNELESDKTLLGLSIAAIGFFMALFINKDFHITEMMFITIFIALLSFLLTSAMILLVFIRNKKQLMEIIAKTGEAGEDTMLEFLDKWKYLPFVIGIGSSVLFTLSLMFTNIHQKEHNMEQTDKQSVIQPDHSNNISEGLSGLTTANSSGHITKGFSGITTANQAQSDSNTTQQSTSGAESNGQSN